MTGDISRSYKSSTKDSWEGDISIILLRFGFLTCIVIGGQICPRIFGDIVLTKRTSFVLDLGDIERNNFVLRFEGLDKVT
jgi:hypothetical protein